MLEFLTPENIAIAVIIIIFIAQSNYFATKLDLANLKVDFLNALNEIKKYSDEKDKEVLHDIQTDLKEIKERMDRWHQ